MGRGGKRPGAGPPFRLDNARAITIVVDRETEAKIEAWQNLLKLSRSEVIRRLLRAAPPPNRGEKT